MTSAGVLDDLEARGLVQECTDRVGLAARLAEGPVSLYYGVDPTADSMHVGNLLGLLVLRRFQDAGHRPIALAGGATGMIGDPGGRSEERNLLDAETLERNVAAIKGQIERIVDLSSESRGQLVDNLAWTGEVRLLDFLRDIGKHVTVNTMMARESVKNRLASEHGISFTEFSYMLLQAHDYLRLEADRGVQLQIGGSDQWGNMVGGVDLIRRVRSRPAWALAWPLLTAPDGTKLGKSTGARIWLDRHRTSPYQLFQHWMGTDDRQVRQFLLQFTLLPVAVVEDAMQAHTAEPGRREAQRLLAREATTIVHGAGDAQAAEQATGVLFGAPLDGITHEALAAIEAEVPSGRRSSAAFARGVDLVDLLAEGELLTSSKGEARRAIDQGGVYVNGQRAPAGAVVTDADLLLGTHVLIRRGKKSYAVVVAEA